MRDWVLVTGASGRFWELLDIVRPGFEAYADRWGMDYLEAETSCSWEKVPVLMEALERHQGAIWIDADAAIVDGSEDVRPLLGHHGWGWVVHDLPTESVPNCGFLVLRQSARVVLREMLDLRWKYENHGWWEQGAALELFGWEPNPGRCRFVGGSVFSAATLPLRWNSLPDRLPETNPAVVHASGMSHDTRLEVLGALMRS